MVQWQRKSKRSSTGKKTKSYKKKKKYQRGRDFLPARLGEFRVVKNKVKGTGEKKIVFSTDVVSVAKDGKVEKAKIEEVLENTADSHYVRRNIITKGAVLRTDKGKVVVTNRPGQHGTVNGKFVE